MSNFDILDEIFDVIKSRKNTDPDKSYVAKLYNKGSNKIAQKLGEEAVELVIDYVDGNKKNTISESADLLFHLMILWSDMGINPKKVMEELKNRKGISGLDEKKSRKK